MALGRLDVPGLILYNGTIYPGTYKGQRNATVVSVYEAIGQYRAGKITLDELYEIENVACPGAGACGGQFTANTMSTAMEFLGISPAGLNGIPAEDPAKDEAARRSGELVMDLVRADRRPSSFITRASIENAIASVAAMGGSTNGVLHLLAIAHEFGIPLAIDEFGAIADRTPIVADMSPGGRYHASDLYDAGGVALVARELLKRDLIDGSTPNVDGRTLGEIAAAAVATDGQKVVYPIDAPLKATGGLSILHGSLAPDGCVVKLAGHERRLHRGPARVFESEIECYNAVREQQIVPGDVVVIRNEGPVGGPGMQEMLGVTAALVGEGLGDLVSLITDGRFSGRHPRPDDRPHRPRSRARRPDRRRPRGRHHRDRRRPRGARPRDPGRRARPPARRMDAARAALHRRGHGEVRRARRARRRAARSRPGRG